jgi:hypothetical protein
MELAEVSLFCASIAGAMNRQKSAGATPRRLSDDSENGRASGSGSYIVARISSTERLTSRKKRSRGATICVGHGPFIVQTSG